MSDNSNNEMLGLFIEESKEHLEVVEPSLLTMEEKGDDTDPEVINTVFRAIHSIKGSAGFFGLKNITELSHTMENLMALVREGSISTTPELINVLLKGLDKLEGMIEDVSASDEVDVSVEIELIETLMSGDENKELIDNSKESVTTEPSSNEDNNPIWQVEEYTEAVEQAISKGHRLYSVAVPLHGETETRHKIIFEKKDFLSSIGFIIASRPDISEAEGITELSADKTAVLNLLFSTILEKSLLIESAGLTEDDIVPVDIKTAAKPVITKDQDAAAGSGTASAEKDKTPDEKIKNNLPVIRDSSEPAPAANKSQAAQKKETAKASPTSETVRVRVDLLDKIMALAGEIVLGRNQLLRQYAGRKNNSILIDHSQRVTELQENVMKTRLQPVGAVFSKFKRIVRDMARKVDKKINLLIEGEDVELDRSIIEVLSDPLTHMIRNSVDHAIESSDDRVKSGKSETGLINLRASHEGGLVVIEIEDDGRGIDAAMIKKKALGKGIISDDDAKKMSDKELVNLIFHPGFSTVTEVSELSGRGVGMDVVKRSFEKLGSTIDLQSTPGEGTLFTVRLPLTLAILPSIIVTVGANTFAIPQIDITEIVRIRREDLAEQLEDIEGQSVFRLRGKLLPVISLAKILEMRDQEQTGETIQHPPETCIADNEDTESSRTIERLIVTRYGTNQLGLLVDTVLDPEEIVVKPMPQLVRSCKIFASATIMGDGHVAMILNIGGIIEKAGFRFESLEKEARQFEEDERKKAMQEMQNILIFKNPADEYFGISLSMISRIEKVKSDEITSLAGKKFIHFRGKSIQLIHVEDYITKDEREEISGSVYVIIPKNSGQILGIVAEDIVDVIDVSLDLDETSIDSPVVIGSSIIEKRMTLMIDVYTLLEKALPDYGSSSKKQTEVTGGVRILLVEDTPFFRNLEERYFISAGFEVTTAPDGGKALEILKARPQAFDIIVSDIEMPVMNGYELVSAIRNNEGLSHLPVMALTSLNTEASKKRGLDAGFDAYEVKVDKESLVKRVSELIQNQRQDEPLKGAVGT